MRTKEKILGHTSTNHPFGDRMLEVLIDIRDILAKTSTSTVSLKIDSDPLSIMEILKGTKREKQDV